MISAWWLIFCTFYPDLWICNLHILEDPDHKHCQCLSYKSMWFLRLNIYFPWIAVKNVITIFFSGENVSKSQSCPSFESDDPRDKSYTERREPLADFSTGNPVTILKYQHHISQIFQILVESPPLLPFFYNVLFYVIEISEFFAFLFLKEFQSILRLWW